MEGTDGSCERIAVRISRDRLSCALVILPGPAETVPATFEAIAVLEAEGICVSLIDQNAVVFLLEQARALPDEEHRATVALGSPAIDEKRAGFTLDPTLTERLASIHERQRLIRSGERTPGEDPPEANAGGGPGCGSTDGTDTAVDFRSESSFVVVNAGDCLGSITPATPGKDGMTVRGESIPCKKTASLSLEEHRTITIEKNRVIAANSGVLRVEPIIAVRLRNEEGLAEPSRVVVEPVLEIDDGVDYATGNVSFPGDIVIRGGVKDNFIVEAGGTLTVRGLIEAADIRCMGEAFFEHGMAGRESGTLEILGDLRAGYLDGVNGTVMGELVVSHEIKGCRLHVGRGIASPGVAIFGGEICSEREIDAGVIGAPGGVETTVSVGVDEKVTVLSSQIAGFLTDVREWRDRGEAEYVALRKRLSTLNRTQAERLTELEFEQQTASSLEEKITQAARNLLGATEQWSSTRVIARKAIHKGVHLRLRHIAMMMKQTIIGTVEFTLDGQGNPVCRLDDATTPTPIESIATVSEASADAMKMLYEAAETDRPAA